MKRSVLQFTLLVSICIYSCSKKNNTTSSGQYYPKVKGIVNNNCMSCHDSKGAWTGKPTAFDTDSAIAAQHAAIKAAVADPVTTTNKRMPEDHPLTQADIDNIVNWNAKGGKLTD